MITGESKIVIDAGIPREYICKYRKQCGDHTACKQCKGYEIDDVYVQESKQVFLGGTYAESTWRERAVKDLSGLTYFNPQLPVGAWNDDAYGNERIHMNIDKIMLFVITPEQVNHFSYAEVVDLAHRRKGLLYFTFIAEEHGKSFTDSEIKVIKKIGNLVEGAGGHYFDKYDDAITAILKYFEESSLEE